MEPEKTGSVFRKHAKDEVLDYILCVKEEHVVDAGGVFSYGGKSFKVVGGAPACNPTLIERRHESEEVYNKTVRVTERALFGKCR